MRKHPPLQVDSEEEIATESVITDPSEIVLIENRKRCTIRVSDGPEAAQKFYDIIPGLNLVPNRIWDQAKSGFKDTSDDKLKSVMQLMVEEGDVVEHGNTALTALPTADAVAIASRPMGVPVAEAWLKQETRKRVRETLQNAIEAQG